jgi:hypothetical protein
MCFYTILQLPFSSTHSLTDGLDGGALEAYRGAIIADQNAKLSAFCTRPAIYVPLQNFVSANHFAVSLHVLFSVLQSV